MRISFVLILGLVCTFGACQKNSNSKEEAHSYPIEKTDTEWKKILSDEQFRILRQQGTEYAFTASVLG